MKEVRFPADLDLYCRLPVHRLDLEIYGDFHIWQPNTVAEFFY